MVNGNGVVIKAHVVVITNIYCQGVHLSVYNRHSKAMGCLLMGCFLKKIKFMIGCFLHIEISCARKNVNILHLPPPPLAAIILAGVLLQAVSHPFF